MSENEPIWQTGKRDPGLGRVQGEHLSASNPKPEAEAHPEPPTGPDRNRQMVGAAVNRSIAVVAPCKPSRELLTAHMPAHPHAERMRQLRTELMLRHSGSHAKSLALAILSPAVGEGRSVLAAELALTFSQLGRPTLLIDADLRHPRQHQLFQVEANDGLRQIVGQFDPKVVKRVEGFPALHLLTAGEGGTQNPSEVLSDGWFDALIRRCRETFDYIVVDTPQFSEFTDARVIATVVGQALIVNRAGQSSVAANNELLRQLEPSGARVVGAVLNHF